MCQETDMHDTTKRFTSLKALVAPERRRSIDVLEGSSTSIKQDLHCSTLSVVESNVPRKRRFSSADPRLAPNFPPKKKSTVDGAPQPSSSNKTNLLNPDELARKRPRAKSFSGGLPGLLGVQSAKDSLANHPPVSEIRYGLDFLRLLPRKMRLYYHVPLISALQ